MGILDDAIREHLELKRRHGADSSDLERLESEAFGPATRPGDPEFEAPTGEADVAEPPTGEAPEEAPASEAPAAGAGEGEGGDWLEAIEDELEDAPVDPHPGTEEEVGETATEQARIEHSDLADTVDHPAVPGPETDEDSAAEAAPAAEPEPTEAPEAAIFEEPDEDGGLGDLDLDLDLDSDAADVAPAAEPESAEFELELPSEDVAEHPLPTAPDTAEEPFSETGEHGLDTAEEPLPDAPEPEAPTGDGDEGDGEDDAEDLLEETPEFLKDAPEGESLWFEQAPPKDFDFDDD